MSEPIQENDCPICFEPDSLRDREAVCPNGHRLCATCQPRIEYAWNASCPLCRARLPRPPIRVIAAGERFWETNTDEPNIPIHVHGDPIPRRVVDHTETEVRRQRANAAFNDIPRRREAQQLFLQNRQTGRIPETAKFGGFHERNCPCGRHGGAEGVRFFKLRNNTRRYRCEVCYRAEMGEDPPSPPDWNLPAVAMHNDVPI